MKYLSIIRYLLLAVSALVVIAFFAQGGVDEDVVYMLNWMYLMIGLTVATAVIMPLISLLKNPADAGRSLIGLAVIAVIVLIAYSAADATPITTPSGVYENALELKFSDTGLFTTYTALALSFVSIIVAEVVNVFK